MITISLCMIVKNEEDVLARCLDCAKQFADEIIIVDTGSEDNTKKIAQQYTQQVYDFIWCDDFSKARNFAFSKASMEYCMWLDADDVVLQGDIDRLLQLKQSLDPAVSIVMMTYATAFDEAGKATFAYYRERLMRRSDGLQWEGVIHEVIPLIGRLQYEDIAITHRKMRVSDPHRNLNIFEARKAQGVLFSPREQFYYARELYYHQRYQDAVAAFRLFLDGRCGWIENNIDACELMGYCYYGLGQEEEALKSFYQSFLYDKPRAELCCDVGKHFFDRSQYELAIYWYERALASERKDESGGFVRVDCYGYIPCLQLCVCWYRLHDIVKAHAYNEQAGALKDSEAVRQNREFFQHSI